MALGLRLAKDVEGHTDDVAVLRAIVDARQPSAVPVSPRVLVDAEEQADARFAIAISVFAPDEPGETRFLARLAAGFDEASVRLGRAGLAYAGEATEAPSCSPAASELAQLDLGRQLARPFFLAARLAARRIARLPPFSTKVRCAAAVSRSSADRISMPRSVRRCAVLSASTSFTQRRPPAP